MASDGQFPIVGIGASAGGLEAFSELLHHLPTNTGMAFVVVQHLSPGHESILPQLLARTTTMPVHEVTNEMRVEPNQVYVIPANASMSIAEGTLKLGPHEHSRGKLRAIDFFLESLARERGPRAIGVILSGSDFDGTAGLAAIKAEGGITFAQDEKSARFDSMPRHAMASGNVDMVFPPGIIGEELGQLAKSLGTKRAVEVKEDPSSEKDGFKKIIQQLRIRKGVDLSLYKSNTIRRRMKRRMLMKKIEHLHAYSRYLGAHPEEMEALYQDVFINVTSFFRDPEMFQWLKQKAFPQLIKNRTPDEPVRIWVVGCSTGQEAYSLAMAYLEFSSRQNNRVPLQIFATDINEAQLEKARIGRYSHPQAEELSPERLRRFFAKENGSYHISKQIRELCVFAHHDIARDPPFSRMDLISCRNLLIYFEPPLQKKSPSHSSLRAQTARLPCAWELRNSWGVFEPVRLGKPAVQDFFQKTGGGPSKTGVSEGKKANDKATKPPLPPPGASMESEAIREADRLALGKYAPVGVVVNEDGEVIQFRGATGHYLEPTPGKASFNVLKMAREGLLLALRTALNRARKDFQQVRKEGLTVHFDGQSERLSLEVIPLKNQGHRCFLILFEPLQGPQNRRLARPAQTQRVGSKAEAGVKIAELRSELVAAREHLQSITEQFEAANEELQSSNEEALSANEELQSINEELQTTKEELQSANEELQTVNEEMNVRNVELHRLNNDLNNVLTGVQMAIVVLGRELEIRRFTPLAQKLFNLVPTDAGRPITNIRTNLEFPDLETFIRGAMDQIEAKQTEVQDKAGHWYSLRVLPYRTQDDRIDGAVVVLVDIDLLKRSEERIQSALNYAEGTLDAVREPMLVLDSNLRVESASRSYFRHFRLSPEETVGKSFYELGNGQWNIPQLRELLEKVLPENTGFDDFEVQHDFERIGRRTVLLNARRVQPAGNRPHHILLAIEDITERKVVELLRENEERYRTLAESLPQLVWTSRPDGYCDYFNARYTEYTGVPREELAGDGWRETISPLDRERTRDYWLEALRGNVPYDLEYRIRRADGVFRWFKVRATPVYDRTGAIIKWFGTSTDIDETKRAHLLLEESEKWLRLIMDSVKDFAIFTLDSGGNIGTWNPGAENLFGYSGSEILGQPASILFTPEDQENQIPEKEVRLAASEGFSSDERWHLRKDGSRFFVSGTLRAIRDETDQLRGFTKVARDITARKEQEEELRRARDELEDVVEERTAKLRDTIGELEAFSYSISHDMRAPLRSMLSFGQMVLSRYGEQLGEQGRDFVERIITGAKRLDQLVQDILTYSRLGRTELRLHRIDLEALVRDAIHEIPEFQPPKAQIEIRSPLLPVMGHSASLMQCVYNLLANAVKFVPPDTVPQITIWTEPLDGNVRVWFEDNGIGIAPKDQERVFGLFERLHPADRYEGTGVGLSIVRKAVERMNGKVGVESEPGRGSKFWIELQKAEGE